MTATLNLKDTGWLAERLGLSVTTVERLRASSPQSLPPCLRFGRSFRYDEQTVERWIVSQASVTPVNAEEVDHVGG